MKLLTRTNDALVGAVKIIVVLMMAIMLCALSGQVVMRYVFNVALSWSEELSLALFTWSVLLTSALGVRDRFHVRMSILVETLKEPWRRFAERCIHVATAVFGGYLTFAGFAYFTETRGMTSAAIGFPIELLYAAAPTCGILIFMFAVEHAIDGTIPKVEVESFV